MWYCYSATPLLLSGLVAEKGEKSQCFQPQSASFAAFFLALLSNQSKSKPLGFPIVRRLISPIPAIFAFYRLVLAGPESRYLARKVMIAFILIQVIRKKRNPFCPSSLAHLVERE